MGEPPSASCLAVSTSPFCQYRDFGSMKITGSGRVAAYLSRWYASCGFDGETTFRPGTWAKSASRLSPWCSGARMPPKLGTRRVIGIGMVPRLR